ncbi:MAG: DUF261 family protein [Bacteroidales bacterium]|nr:DUF261 family protein [Bacteroidales bacterium]
MKQEKFKEINAQIFKNGCYLLSLIYIFEKVSNIKLKEQDVLELYLNLTKRNFITENCFIISPENVLNYMFNFYRFKKKVINTFVTDYFNKDDLFNSYNYFVAKVRTRFGTTHFIVVKKEDEKIICEYDPSLVVEKKENGKYNIISIRFFLIK